MKEKAEKTLNIISYTLLALVFIGIVASLIYHILGLGDVKETSQHQNLQESEYCLFYPVLVDSIEIVDNDTAYYANVYYGDTLVLYTSVEEAESLITQMESAYSRYSEDALELEEALGSITDNASITKIGDSYILALDWIKK